MVRTTFIFSIMLFFGGVTGHVSNIYAAPKNIANYDSSANFLNADVTKYVGQELYLIQKPESDRDFGYTGFFVVPDSKDSNAYKPNDKFYSTYSALAGKYFKVIKIVPNSEAPRGEYFADGKCFLQLKTDSGDVVYYEYNSANEYSFPFMVRGFYEKQKTAYKGSYFVYPDTVLKALACKTDVVTGKPVTFRTGETWKCIDVKVPENSHNLSLVIQNNLGEKTTTPYGCRSYNLLEVLTYKKKYGIATFNKLIRGDLYPGMTKEMVKLSVGEPYQINGKLTHGTDRKKEEWLYYSGKSLVFDNDMLIELKDTVTN
jgi:hypothetical protein